MIYTNKQHLIKDLVKPSDTVLDVGFLGQGVQEGDANWPHTILKNTARHVYGIDLEITDKHKNNPNYMAASAEDFNFHTTFDVVFAGDLIEHLSNPGLFLTCVKKHLKPGGILILTTPNTFNLFNLTEKLTKKEPTTNPDHTFYFNNKVLRQLLDKNGMNVKQVDYLYSLGYKHKESWKKKTLNCIYWALSKVTDKFTETLVIVASVK
jgi:2-polyprenyl-3-methyl-5-hydroxy-6-metoxy-1,4-benzoquinol methylase